MKSFDIAKQFLKAGLSPIPIKAGEKRPAIPSWKEYQERPMSEAEAAHYFTNGQHMGIAAGVGSRNLEVIDFDEIDYFEAWCKMVDPHLLTRLVIIQTPSGGRHVLYRCNKIDGNKILARTESGTVAIETRGQGGYIVTYPTPGYKPFGKFADIPTLSEEEREDLFSHAYLLHKGQDLTIPERTFPQERKRQVGQWETTTSWADLLEPLGWRRGHTIGGNTHWTRPGKTKGTSATTNGEDGHLYVFTSNAPPLEPGRSYTKFGAYSFLYHKGDFHFASQQIRPKKTERVYDPPVQTTPRKWLCFDEIDEKPIDWLYEPYLPSGIGYVLVYGDSNQGKSTAILAMVADFSNGKIPNSDIKIEPVRSIILSAEDSAHYVVKPRLKQLGANMKMIMAPEEFHEDGTPNPLTLDAAGAAELQAQVKAFGAKIVVIDPLTAYFDGDNINDRIQARAWTRRITNIAISCGCCPIVVHHVNKSTSAQGRYRAAGNQDLFDASRSALMAVQSQSNPDDYALSHEKYNLSVRGDSLGYTFNKDFGFQWTGASDLTSDLVQIQAEFAEHVEPSKLKSCQEWILETLEGNGGMPSVDLKKGAKQAGYPARTFERAKSELGRKLRTFKVQGMGPTAPWMVEVRQLEGGDV